MQNTVQKEESIRLGSGILKINDVNIGAIKSAGVDASFLISSIKFANAKLPPRKKLEKVIFKADIVELHLDTLKTIFGGELTTLLAEGNDEINHDRKVLTFDDFTKILDMYPVVFENTNEQGKKFGIKIFKGYATSSLAFDFADDEDLESFASIPVEFEGYPDSNNKIFEIFDEQSIT